MKILVIGSNGMAGHMISRYLFEKGYSIDTAARSNAKFLIDIENFSLTYNFLQDIKNDYDYIINCIGLLVKDSIDRSDRAAIINSWFPHAIEHAIRDSKTKLIHLSTDCVFDGKKGNYVELDTHTETNAYGRSKSLGEVINNKDITFRMSIIGTEIKKNGTGLLNWILTNSDSTISGWENALWNGITTLQLAKCIDSYINNPNISGVYHVVNNDININKYDLLCLINDTFNLNKTIVRTLGPKDINKILVDTTKTFNFQIPNYQTQLEELKNYV
jgi:dTDP-4-dehydrorhamnose reductase